MRGGLYNFPVDFQHFVAVHRCPVPFLAFAEPGFDGSAYSQPRRALPAETLNLFSAEAFKNSLFWAAGRSTDVLPEKLAGCDSLGVAPHPLKHQVGDRERGPCGESVNRFSVLLTGGDGDLDQDPR